MMWFTEQAGFSGQRRFQIWSREDPPPDHAPDRFLRPPVAVPGYLQDLPLNQVAQFLALGGEFEGYDHETCRAIAQYLKDPADVSPLTIREVHA